MYILSYEERIGIILYELLSANKVYTYSKLQEVLAVSKSTIVSDLKKSKQWLIKYNLNIEKHSKSGIVINGEEKNIRKAITDLLIGNTGYNIVKTLEKIYNTENSNFISNIKKMELSDSNLKYIKELIREVEDEFGVFTDSDFMNLVFTVFVMVNRSKVKIEKGNNNNFEIKDQYKKEYDSAKKIVEKLQQNLDVVINKESIDHLATMIASVSKNENNLFDSKDYFTACSIADTICSNFNKKYLKEIKMDEKLYESFINHLKALILRIKFKMEIKNPIIDSIISNYRQYFDFLRGSCRFIEERYNCTLNDDEIGYITLYICAAIEKNKCNTKNKAKNILIVCSYGFATGRLLESRIKSNFNVNIYAVTSVHGISKYIKECSIDLIVSTVKIEDKFNTPVLVVSSIFGSNDMDILKEYLQYKTNSLSNDVVKDILNVVSNTCIIEDREGLIIELNKYFKIQNIDNRCIEQYLDLSHIQLNLEANNWEEAIRISSNPLLVHNIIEEDYIAEMIESVKTFGPYMVIDNGIALPHAKSENNVNEFGITFNTFKKPISLGEHNNVRIFIVLATKDKKSNIPIITELMKLIEDENFIDTLLNSNNKNEVLNYISRPF